MVEGRGYGLLRRRGGRTEEMREEKRVEVSREVVREEGEGVRVEGDVSGSFVLGKRE